MFVIVIDSSDNKQYINVNHIVSICAESLVSGQKLMVKMINGETIEITHDESASVLIRKLPF